jgi:hypothetical protein
MPTDGAESANHEILLTKGFQQKNTELIMHQISLVKLMKK